MAFFSKLGRRKSKAWRNFENGEIEWSKEQRDRLKHDIPGITISSTETVTKGKIVLLGPVKSGKSSFINSILSVNKGRLVQMAPDGGGLNSVTRKLDQFICGNFLICDTMGLESRDDVGFNIKDVLYLLKGNISENYEFQQTCPINESTPGFNPAPANADRVHCVIYCISANDVQNEVQAGYIQKWQALQKEINFHGIPRIIILTKIDIICKEVKDDLSNTFKSKMVREVVKKASELFALPEMYIHPVKNLTTETFPEPKQSILLLLALKQALEFAEDYMEKMNRDGRDTTV